jgi:DNA-directed RNA polymerase omega subunit
MNDYERATQRIGNRFNLVLIAAQRLREIQSKRNQEMDKNPDALELNRRRPVPAHQAITDIENGLVGLEYLGKIANRDRQR